MISYQNFSEIPVTCVKLQEIDGFALFLAENTSPSQTPTPQTGSSPTPARNLTHLSSPPVWKFIRYTLQLYTKMPRNLKQDCDMPEKDMFEKFEKVLDQKFSNAQKQQAELLSTKFEEYENRQNKTLRELEERIETSLLKKVRQECAEVHKSVMFEVNDKIEKTEAKQAEFEKKIQSQVQNLNTSSLAEKAIDRYRKSQNGISNYNNGFYIHDICAQIKNISPETYKIISDPKTSNYVIENQIILFLNAYMSGKYSGNEDQSTVETTEHITRDDLDLIFLVGKKGTTRGFSMRFLSKEKANRIRNLIYAASRTLKTNKKDSIPMKTSRMRTNIDYADKQVSRFTQILFLAKSNNLITSFVINLDHMPGGSAIEVSVKVRFNGTANLINIPLTGQSFAICANELITAAADADPSHTAKFQKEVDDLNKKLKDKTIPFIPPLAALSPIQPTPHTPPNE